MRKFLFGAVGALFAVATQAQAQLAPIHEWTFNNGTATDVVGGLNGTLHGDATVSNGKLILDGAGSGANRTYMSTADDNVSLTAMTLVSWVSLSTASQSGGSALSAVTDGQTFDAIDYGEATGNQWTNGSDYFSRTRANDGGALSTDLNEHMMAITYSASGQITIYKDGVFYADDGTYSPATLIDPHYLLGLRHDAAGQPGMLIGSIDMAAVYSTALSANDIATLYAAGPNAVGSSVPEPASWAMMVGGFGLLGAALRRRKANVSFA